MLVQTPWLLFISSCNFVWLAFIKLSVIGKIFHKCKGFEKRQFYKINQELRCGYLVLKQTFQVTVKAGTQERGTEVMWFHTGNYRNDAGSYYQQ